MTQHVQLPSGIVLDLDRVTAMHPGQTFVAIEGYDPTCANEMQLFGDDLAVMREWMASVPKLADLIRRTA